MIHTPASLLVSQKQQTKCPGIITKCPGITQLPSLVMRVCARPLKISLAQRGIILPSLPALATVNQCPGIILQTVIMNNAKQCLALPRKRGIGILEEKEEQEKEQREEKCIIMMRAGPLSAQATRLIPAFQHKWSSQAYRTATPYQPCGPRCTTHANLWVTDGPMRIRHSKLDQTLVNLQAYINRPTQPLSTTLGPTPQ